MRWVPVNVGLVANTTDRVEREVRVVVVVDVGASSQGGSAVTMLGTTRGLRSPVHVTAAL